MNIAVTLPDEKWELTMEFISSKRNWDVENQLYRRPDLEDCKAKLSDCQFYWRGNYLIVEYDGIVHYWECGERNYFRVAIELIDLDRPANWKTLDLLLSLRMGIRQTESNCCGYVESVLDGEVMTLNLYNKFMKLARAQDRQHHGSSTF
jgi:hypothetical protein